MFRVDWGYDDKLALLDMINQVVAINSTEPASATRPFRISGVNSSSKRRLPGAELRQGFDSRGGIEQAVLPLPTQAANGTEIVIAQRRLRPEGDRYICGVNRVRFNSIAERGVINIVRACKLSIR